MNDRHSTASRSDPVRSGVLPLPLVIALVSLWLAALCNTALWGRVRDAVSADGWRDEMFLGAAFLSVALLFNLLLTVAMIVRPLAKTVLVGTVLIGATAAAFMHQYGVLIDRAMIQSVFETDAAEVRDLLGWRLLLVWSALGLLPALLLTRTPLRRRSFRGSMAESGAAAATSLLGLALVVLTFGSDYASLLRNHRELRFMLTPTNAIWYTASYLRRSSAPSKSLEVVGGDAKRLKGSAGSTRPAVIVLVLGETARAEDFSLGGHARETNPLLKRADGIYFTDVTACGTATAVSLPCMFSDLGRKGFDASTSQHRENLLDVVQRAGVDVLWLENNSGCKGVCARVPVESFDASRYPDLCDERECFDEILVRDLRDHLAALRRDTLIVLHQKGSHGPAYFKRYPPAFERFQPTCVTARLSDCTREALHNTYDNTIVYTDYVVAQVIEALRARADSLDGTVLYVSDHGESLGEAGLYLHGAPFAVAPNTQVHVPAYAWLSTGFQEKSRISMECLREVSGRAYSHDNLFHTVLALSDVDTAAYRRPMDMFAPCRAGTKAAFKAELVRNG